MYVALGTLVVTSRPAESIIPVIGYFKLITLNKKCFLSFSPHFVIVTFSKFSRTAVVGTTITCTWTSASNSVSGDSIGLLNRYTSTIVGSVTVSAGFNNGTYSAVMPNSPGSSYSFVYLRNGKYLGLSVYIVSVVAPTATPTVTPTASPAKLSGGIYCVFFMFS